jgi:gliding motility-associated-like protein
MKSKLFLILILISFKAFSQTSPILYVGSEEGLSINSNAIFHADGLTIAPSENLELKNTLLSRSSNSIAPLSNQASRVYQFSNPTSNFTGSLTFNYLDSEVGTLEEKDLQLVVHNTSQWYRQNTSVDVRNNTMNSTFGNLALGEISSFVFKPSLILASSSITENSPLGTKIIDLFGTDQNLGGEELTYALVSGSGSADNNKFYIVNNELKSNSEINYENKKVYSVRIRVTDKYNRSDEKILSIAVRDLNEAPTALAISKANLFEANFINQIVGLLGSTDQDEADSHSYSLVSGTGSTDNAAFNISGNQIRASQVYAFDSKKDYTIRVKTTDKAGLSFERIIPISISELPTLTGTGNVLASKVQVAASTNPKISKGFSSNLFVSGSDLVGYTWNSPTTGLNSSNISNPIAEPNQTTMYSVLVTNAYGSSVTLSITVEVMEDYNVTANNLITPNGDGENDLWTVENLKSYPDNKLTILDRSGKVIYTKTNYENNWDGLFNGVMLPEDTYYYVFSFNSGAVVKKGFITLLK